MKLTGVGFLLAVYGFGSQLQLIPMFGLHTHTATKQEKYRYLIYKDLWECGYTLTTGLKFGGDYLVYKGHPHTVHASFIAVVLPWKQTIRSFGAVTRVGTKVKKSILLCSMDEEGMVHYLTVDWSM